MHREIQNHIEEALDSQRASQSLVSQHLDGCPECGGEIRAMREQAALLRDLRAPADLEPGVGFYARVLQRIEAEGPVSIWNLFIESAFGKRIALASLALALLLGVYVISSERAAQDPAVQDAVVATEQTPLPGNAPLASGPLTVMGEDAPGRVITQMDQFVDSDANSSDAVLANLVTYNEQ